MSLRQQILDLNKRLEDLPIRQGTILVEFLSDLKSTIKEIFGPKNQYLEYLQYVRFRPDAVFVTEREAIRSWHSGRAQVMNLLRVILNDPLVRQGEAVQEMDEVLNPEEAYIRRFSDLQGSILGTTNQFQKEVLNRISRSAEEIGPIEEPLRKDSFRELPESDRSVVKDEPAPDKVHPRIFVSTGSDQLINREVSQFLSATSAQVIENESLNRTREALIEQLNRFAAVDFAVFILSADFHFYARTQSQEYAPLMAAQEVVFQLGYFVAKLGRDRVAVLYQENDRFRRPTEYFDIHYFPLDKNRTWKNGLIKRIASCGFEIEMSDLL